MYGVNTRPRVLKATHETLPADGFERCPTILNILWVGCERA